MSRNCGRRNRGSIGRNHKALHWHAFVVFCTRTFCRHDFPAFFVVVHHPTSKPLPTFRTVLLMEGQSYIQIKSKEEEQEPKHFNFFVLDHHHHRGCGGCWGRWGDDDHVCLHQYYVLYFLKYTLHKNTLEFVLFRLYFYHLPWHGWLSDGESGRLHCNLKFFVHVLN